MTLSSLLPHVPAVAPQDLAAAMAPGPAPARSSAPGPEPENGGDDRYHIKQRNRGLLIVEDDPRNGQLLLERAHERGFQALFATSGEEALVLARDCSPAGIVLDLGLPDIPGLDLLEMLVMKPGCPHITLFTGRPLSTDDLARIERHTSSIVSKSDRAINRLVPEHDHFLNDVARRRASAGEPPWVPGHVLPGRTFLITKPIELDRLCELLFTWIGEIPAPPPAEAPGSTTGSRA